MLQLRGHLMSHLTSGWSKQDGVQLKQELKHISTMCLLTWASSVKQADMELLVWQNYPDLKAKTCPRASKFLWYQSLAVALELQSMKALDTMLHLVLQKKTLESYCALRLGTTWPQLAISWYFLQGFSRLLSGDKRMGGAEFGLLSNYINPRAVASCGKLVW